MVIISTRNGGLTDMNYQAQTTVYNASDAANLLNLQPSTLRKYANILQKAGYKFHKNQQGHRSYFERDIVVLRRFITTKENPDITLEQSANAVMSWVIQEKVSPRNHSNATDLSTEQHYITYDKFSRFQEKQEGQMQNLIGANKELVDRLDRQQIFLENRLKQRDEKLLETINLALNTRRQIASSREKQEEDTKKKTGFFKRLFSKKDGRS
jgi:DNA-binding transcriptional MerR regulator